MNNAVKLENRHTKSILDNNYTKCNREAQLKNIPSIEKLNLEG